MKIHANHFIYDELSNAHKTPFNILMFYISNEANPDFESYIPEWPKDAIDEQEITITSKCYLDINLMNNYVNFDLIILAVENINQFEAQEINALLLKITPKNAILLYQDHNTYQTITRINSFIRCDCTLLKGMFAVGWTVATLCLYTNQLIGFDFSDFTEVVCKFKYGVMHVVNQTSQVNNYEGLAKEALNNWQLDHDDTNEIASLFSATNIKFKNIDFRMADYTKIIALYQERFRELGIFPLYVFGVSVPQTTYQAYPFIQITMLGNTTQLKANLVSQQLTESSKTRDIQKWDIPVSLRHDVKAVDFPIFFINFIHSGHEFIRLYNAL